jgi:hypothetical protein
MGSSVRAIVPGNDPAFVFVSARMRNRLVNGPRLEDFKLHGSSRLTHNPGLIID